jgi:hypothetical protein
MSVTKTIQIDGKDVTFRASAAVPRMYRIKFRRDIFQDMSILMKDLEKAKEREKAAAIAEGREWKDDGSISVSFLDISSLEIFENVAYMMAKYGDPDNVPNTADEWLDQFQTFSIYMIFPQLVELWGMNTEQINESKKNFDNVTGK